MSGVDLSAIDGTTLAGIDLRGVPLDRRLPPVPRWRRRTRRLGEAELAGADDIASCWDPSPGETILVVPAGRELVPDRGVARGSIVDG